MYTKQNFEDGQVLTAAQLDYMEEGIRTIDTTLGDVSAALDEIISIQEALIGGDEV